MKSGDEITIRKILNFLAFVGIVLYAISVFIGRWIPQAGEVASIIGLVIMATAAYFYARSKRNQAYIIAWVIIIGLIIIFKGWIWFWPV